jgi:hypothetical protein
MTWLRLPGFAWFIFIFSFGFVKHAEQANKTRVREKVGIEDRQAKVRLCCDEEEEGSFKLET